MKQEEISEEILKLIEEHGLSDDGQITFEVEEEEEEQENPVEHDAVFIQTSRGKTILQYNNHRYRKAYKCKNGTRWNCSVDKQCSAFVYVNEADEIIMSNQDHIHPSPVIETIDSEQNDTAVVITSRKGKEMLLFRQYTYRKQYDKGDRSRWVCSTLKNCRGYVFTDSNNMITAAFEEHCHNPPKYYLKPNHVLEALREPLILETD